MERETIMTKEIFVTNPKLIPTEPVQILPTVPEETTNGKIKTTWEFLKKYHLILICFIISGLASTGIIFYSASYGDTVFPNVGVGLIFMLIIEVGLITVKYIAVAAEKETRRKEKNFFVKVLNLIFSDNTLLGILFLLSVIPATLGTGEKHRKAEKKPTLSVLVTNYEAENENLFALIEKNNELIDRAKSFNRIDALQTDIKKWQKKIDENDKEIKKHRTEFDALYKKYMNENGDVFYNFINDFFLKFLVIGVQILNIWCTLTGSRELKKIRSKDKEATAAQIEPSKLNLINTQLAEHQKQIETIREYTQSIKKDMIELNGELEG